MTKFLRLLYNKLVRARKPGFVLCCPNFGADEPNANDLHWRLFFLSCRRPINALLNLCAYVRWMCYYTWLLSYKACKEKSADQLNKYGLQRHALFWALVKQGIIHTIPPHYYFKYRLYLPENHGKATAYVYNQQLPYFHNHSNSEFKHYKKSAQLIANKYQFSKALQNIGVPTVNSVCCDAGLDLLSQKNSVFCKPNIGSQSQDTFYIVHNSTEDSYKIIPIHGQPLTSKHEMESYLTTIFSRHRVLLIQPFIRDHDEVKKISQHHASTTVRIITEKAVDHSLRLLYLQLEIPAEKETKSGREVQYYKLIPLDIDSLDVDSYFKGLPIYSDQHDVIITETLKEMLLESIDYCKLAHAQLLDLNTASFDMIISENGPVMIEANYNWSIELLYFVIDPLDKQTSHPAAVWLNKVISKRN